MTLDITVQTQRAGNILRNLAVKNEIALLARHADLKTRKPLTAKKWKQQSHRKCFGKKVPAALSVH